MIERIEFSVPRRLIRYNLTSGRADLAEGMTTTVWRPRVRIDVPDVGDAEDTDTSKEELTTRGTKRKRAPMHHGPCEHGVKHRSKCKVCSACPHGRQRSLQGVWWGINLRAQSSALYMQRVRWCINLRARSSAH